jgi:hypothetical protein
MRVGRGFLAGILALTLSRTSLAAARIPSLRTAAQLDLAHRANLVLALRGGEGREMSTSKKQTVTIDIVSDTV